MAQVNYGTAQSQAVLMKQKVDQMIEVSQNLDATLAKMFSMRGDEIGFRTIGNPFRPKWVALGALSARWWQLLQGSGPEYTQFVPAPIPIMDSISTTELASRISRGGKDVVVDDYLARLIKDVKVKVAHKMNRTSRPTTMANWPLLIAHGAEQSTTIPLKAGEFGGRLIDLNDQLQVFDNNQNALGVVNILEINKNSIGGFDTVIIDAVPDGMATTSAFYPLNVASGNPVFVAGLKYIVSPTTTGDYFGTVARAALCAVASAQCQRRVLDSGRNLGVPAENGTGARLRTLSGAL